MLSFSDDIDHYSMNSKSTCQQHSSVRIKGVYALYVYVFQALLVFSVPALSLSILHILSVQNRLWQCDDKPFNILVYFHCSMYRVALFITTIQTLFLQQY